MDDEGEDTYDSSYLTGNSYGLEDVAESSEEDQHRRFVDPDPQLFDKMHQSSKAAVKRQALKNNQLELC